MRAPDRSRLPPSGPAGPGGGGGGGSGGRPAGGMGVSARTPPTVRPLPAAAARRNTTGAAAGRKRRRGGHPARALRQAAGDDQCQLWGRRRGERGGTARGTRHRPPEGAAASPRAGD
eukprot:1668901-Pleurochrysis_carterae.AAC.1